MRALVTGGAGFIGSTLVRALLDEGRQVRVLDNFATGRRENLAGIAGDVELIDGDIRHDEVLARAVARVDVVFHEAALGSVSRSVEDPVTTHEVNATGTLKLLLAARDAGVSRVVYAASSSAYGANPELPKIETMVPRPISPYAITKLTGEQYCSVFSQLYGLPTVCLRYFNVFGPHQDPSSVYSAVIPLFMKAAATGERPVVHGDGLQSRDFTFVANVVQANLLAAKVENTGGGVYNIAVGRRVTLRELLDRIGEISGRKLDPRFEPDRPGDVKHSLASIEAARAELGYHPEEDFVEGLRRTWEWFLERPAGSDQ